MDPDPGADDPNRYPCPASLAIAAGAVGFGDEVCPGFADSDSNGIWDIAEEGSDGDEIITPGEMGALGLREGIYVLSGEAGSFVLVGAVPTTALEIADENAYSVPGNNYQPSVLANLHVTGIADTLSGNAIGNFPGGFRTNGHATYSAIFDGRGGDAGGVLIVTEESDNDEEAITAYNRHTNAVVFSVKAFNGDTNIAGNLDVGSTITGNTSPSDARLKDDLSKAAGLEVLEKLQGYDFIWNCTSSEYIGQSCFRR